jgi:hypothetical protein
VHSSNLSLRVCRDACFDRDVHTYDGVTAGKSGVFLGPNEDHFAVVDATGKLAAVFSVAECTHAGGLHVTSHDAEPITDNQHGLLS